MHNPKLSIYAATQGKRECNNNNMRNPSLHPLVSGYACYYCIVDRIKRELRKKEAVREQHSQLRDPPDGLDTQAKEKPTGQVVLLVWV